MALAEDVLRRLDAGQDSRLLGLVGEVYVFGSFARGALEPGDLDVAVEIDHSDRRWAAEAALALSRGRDPYAPIRRALVGASRRCQVVFNVRATADYDMTLLWLRGDTLDVALQRLHAIAADPAAGRAPRDAMLPQFEGIDRWVPRDVREQLIAAVDEGAIMLERLSLTDEVAVSEEADRHLRRRWKPTSPLYRAGRAVLGHFDRRGVSPLSVHLHGRDVGEKVTPYFAGFGLRYFRAIPNCLINWGGREWIEVVHPTTSGELNVLRVVPGDAERLRQTKWS
jgi:hypothetical protein